MLKPSRASAFRRTGLLATTALFVMSGASAALAQDRAALEEAMNAERDEDGSSITRNRIAGSLNSVRFGTLDAQSLVGDGHIAPIDGQETPSITINDNFNTTTDVYDPTNVTGIGQVVRDAGGGSVGLCTGTLINRRTVIFAAHCVNNNAATAYGANSGGIGMAIGFETNTRANAAGQNDELVNWLTGSGAGPGRFQTNQAQSLYNISQIFWNPASRRRLRAPTPPLASWRPTSPPPCSTRRAAMCRPGRCCSRRWPARPRSIRPPAPAIM